MKSASSETKKHQMDKIYPFPFPPESSTTTTSSTSSGGASAPPPKSNGSDYLSHLNKLSHKISKPPLKKPSFDPPLDDTPPPHPPLPPQHQPPVYNINKNDFRDVVQKLTGSPAHERAPAPPPPAVPSPKLPSSRLHRIRPPPLSHLNTRPPPQLNCVAAASLLDPSAITSLNPIPNPNPNPTFFPNNFNFTMGRPSAILSPLPPLPSVHGAAESPVSAYMRHLNTHSLSATDSKGDPLLGFRPSLSPRWSNLALPPLPGQASQRPPEGILPSLQQLPMLAPMPFGCSISPKVPYGLNSPGFLFPPTSLGFPNSPSAVPVPSPRSGGA